MNRNIFSRSQIVPLALSLVALGCSLGVEPEVTVVDAPTSELLPHFSAQSDDTGLHIFARVGTEQNNFIRLPSGDRLVVTVDGGNETVLHENGNDHELLYVADLPAVSKQAEVVIALQRGDGKQSAPLSKALVPAPFKITVAPTTLKVPTNFALAFEGLSGNVDILPSGLCLTSPSSITGRFVDGKVIVDRWAPEFESNTNECDVDFEVRIAMSGSLDSAFGRSSKLFDPIGFESVQRRAFKAHVSR